MANARKQWKLKLEEFNAAMGRAKRLGWIDIRAKNGARLITAKGDVPLGAEETFIEKLGRGSKRVTELSPEGKKGMEALARRPRYLELSSKKETIVALTALGSRIAAKIPSIEVEDVITPELLATGRWRRVKLRPLDVEAPGPILHPGKRHPLQQVIDEVREAFLSMGFKEVEGPLVQPCFWNFDALFVPQDHPAREMQDTFYIQGIKWKRPGPRGLIDRVAAAHENGWTTGSRGWQKPWSLEEASRLVLRTHTTAVTIKYLADHRPREARVFSVDRVFRNEKVTYKSIVEFYQIEGIVVGHKLTLRDLMGLLTEFYRRLGLPKVKFWPSYFPYTEPSLSAMVYLQKAEKWIELGGSGIFRPEVTLPLGVRNPVLAWGLGLERLAMLRLNLEDVRTFYSAELGWLRRTPLCL